MSLIRKITSRIRRYFFLITGVNISIKLSSPIGLFRLLNDLFRFKSKAERSDFPITSLFPCYDDASDNAGQMMHHYFWQDLHVAQAIYKNNPRRHIDIGSSLARFITHVASFREIEVFDIRPLNVKIKNVLFVQADLMDETSILPETIDSVSCLHALEHFGLGRYGDPICPQGHLIGFKNITRILKPGGKFYFSVPMGVHRIEFHAHRVFSMQYLVDMIQPYFTIDEFSYVDDANNFYSAVDYRAGLTNNFNCKFGCAIFELTKK